MVNIDKIHIGDNVGRDKIEGDQIINSGGEDKGKNRIASGYFVVLITAAIIAIITIFAIIINRIDAQIGAYIIIGCIGLSGVAKGIKYLYGQNKN